MSKHPADWEKFSLKELSSLVTSGGTPTSGDSRYYVGSGGYPFAKTEDLSASSSKYLNDCELKITDIGLRNSSAKIYPISTVLISMYGTIGLPKITGVELAANQALCALLPPFKCDVSFLYHTLVHIRKEWIKDSGQTTQANINGGAVKEKKIFLPPRAEQKTIATILDTLDTQIRQTEAIIAKLQQVKQGLLHDLLTRGIGENGQLRPSYEQAPALYKESPLGWIPKEWEWNSLASRVAFPTGQVDPKAFPYRAWILVAPDHIESKTGRLLNQFDAASQNAISGKYAFQPGDVIYSKIRPYLRKAILPNFQGLCSADAYPLRPLAGVNSEYLLAMILGENFSRFAESVSMRSGFPKINRTEMAEFFTGWPLAEEQERIAFVVKGSNEKIALEEQLLIKLKKQKAGLMDDLLTGRARVTELIEQQQAS